MWLSTWVRSPATVRHPGIHQFFSPCARGSRREGVGPPPPTAFAPAGWWAGLESRIVAGRCPLVAAGGMGTSRPVARSRLVVTGAVTLRQSARWRGHGGGSKTPSVRPRWLAWLPHRLRCALPWRGEDCHVAT